MPALPKSPLRSRVTTLLASVAVVLAAASSALASGPRAVAELRNPPAGVEIRTDPASPWTPVQATTHLSAGAFVRTSKSGASLVFPDGAVIAMSPSTTLRVQVGTEISMTVGNNIKVSHVDLIAGDITTSIPPAATPMLVMAGKDLFAAFRQGRSRARKTDTGLMAIVDEGDARVASSGRWFTLRAHEYQMLPERGPVAPPKTMSPPPDLSRAKCSAIAGRACGIGVVVNTGTTRLGASWSQPVPGAKFWIKLARDPAFHDVVDQQTLDGQRTSYMSPLVPMGEYWLAARTVTADGVESDAAIRHMRVVRLLPDLGVTYLPSGNVFVLPPGRKVHVSSPQGLTVSLGLNHTAAAPAELDLPGTQARRNVVLRVAGETADEVPIVIERRALVARVSFSPRNAQWPKDPVQISIRLVDPNRRLGPDSVRPSLRLMVNNTPMTLGLARTREGWQATIPARDGRGPWLIRADVVDSDGVELGDGVLEVTAKSDGDR